MKAIVRDEYGSPEVLRFEDVEKPIPGDDDVTRFRPGDDVWADLFSSGSGALAEYVCAPETAFLPKPVGLSHEQAATLPHSGLLALHALSARGRIEAGQKVLINGAGGCVGPFAVQMAKSLGAEVTGVDHPQKLDMIRSLGADHVVDYTREDYTRTGRRYHLIVDIAANRWVFANRRSVEPGGAYTQIARTLGGFSQAAVLGGLITLASDEQMGVFMWVPNEEAGMKRLAALVTSGQVTPLIDRRYPLSAVAEALRYQEEGLARGKLVV